MVTKGRRGEDPERRGRAGRLIRPHLQPGPHHQAALRLQAEAAPLPFPCQTFVALVGGCRPNLWGNHPVGTLAKFLQQTLLIQKKKVGVHVSTWILFQVQVALGGVERGKSFQPRTSSSQPSNNHCASYQFIASQLQIHPSIPAWW